MIKMNTRIYLRASTKDQDAERALQILQDLNQNLNLGETNVVPLIRPLNSVL